MFVVNKIIGGLISPLGIVLVLLLAAGIGIVRCRHRLALALVALAFSWLWLWSTPLASRVLGLSLESEFLVNGQPPRAESVPTADAILLLGGGMGTSPELGGHSEMWAAADRVWMAARLYRSGKAPRILATGGSAGQSTGPLLRDLGVPDSAQEFHTSPRNTEEEAKAIAAAGFTRVLLVSSAWHLRRARLMFEKYAPQVEIVPVATDFEASTLLVGHGFQFKELLPSVEFLIGNSVAFKEIVGYWGYRWLR